MAASVPPGSVESLPFAGDQRTALLRARISFKGLIERKDMYILRFLQRQKELLSHFRIGRNIELNDSRIQIRTFEFESRTVQPIGLESELELQSDQRISVNCCFHYQVFLPMGQTRSDAFILLLHGLNERNWDKYLIWAEYLARQTRKPVLLFPIAFHINRAPSLWGDPRSMRLVMERRKSESGDHRSLSFVNAALSERLSERPSRFYSSGRQTINDLIQLMQQIRQGEHPLFTAGATADIFSYSIGAFLSEILLMANPEGFFTQSRLFIFCGGSIFSHMYGESRCIMDKPAYDKLYHFYCNEWADILHQTAKSGKVVADEVLMAFNAMINPEVSREFREHFFSSSQGRISGISLNKDTVMPWAGVEACMGSHLADKCFELMDFPYEYTHEFPFPTNGRVEDKVLDHSFGSVFRKAAAFLG